MSDEKPLEPQDQQVALIPHGDFTMKDLEAIEKFKENGLLGLHELVDTDVERMMGLYLDGKSYRQISSLTKKNKTVILFLAHKFKWFELRKDYLEELQAILPSKVVEAKLQSQEFLLHLSLAYRKKIGKSIDQYLRTDNAEFADKIDPKDITTYLKIEDMLHSISSTTPSIPSEKSLVGLNGLGEGVTITKTGANSVEITPSKFGSKLKNFAEFKRAQEKESQIPKKSHDIVTEETLTQKENKDENE